MHWSKWACLFYLDTPPPPAAVNGAEPRSASFTLQRRLRPSRIDHSGLEMAKDRSFSHVGLQC